MADAEAAAAGENAEGTAHAEDDIVLADLQSERVIDKDTFLSKGRNTPFDGWTVYAGIRETIKNGRTVWKGE